MRLSGESAEVAGFDKTFEIRFLVVVGELGTTVVSSLHLASSAELLPGYYNNSSGLTKPARAR